MRRSFSIATLVALFAVSTSALADHHVNGRWKATLGDGEQSRNYYVDISEKDGKVGGTFISPRSGDYKIKTGSLKGKELSFSVEREFNGDTIQLDLSIKLGKDGTGTGSLSVMGNEFGEVSMKKIGNPIGKFAVEATSGENTHKSTLTIEAGKEGLVGKIVHEQGELKPKSIKWIEHEKIQIDLALPRPDADEDVPVVILAEFDKKGALKGTWSVESAGIEGDWVANPIRPKKPAFKLPGVWDVVASTDQQDYESTLTIKKSDGEFKGTYEGDGEVTYKSVSFKKGALRLELDIVMD
ncbi:MAG: hypothetical protein AAF517_17495, partial [Planctomycetota bacterium]